MITDLKNQVNFYEAAKTYLGLNLSVLPTDAEKQPLVLWKQYQTCRMTDDEVQKAFSITNTKGIAIICGEVSGNMEGIDIDTKHDRSGNLWRDFYLTVKDILPELIDRLVIAKTVNNGYHIIYKCEKIEGNRKLANNDQHEVLIETRGNGGYLNVDPTPGYKWVQGNASNIPEITPEERATLFNIARSFDETLPIQEKSSWVPPQNSGGLSSFDDFNERADVPELLVKHGFKVLFQKGEWIHLERPGKNEKKTSATFHVGRRIFYPFSTSTVLEAEKGYNAVGVYTILEHNGDYSSASKQLYEDGYGERFTSSPKEQSVKEDIEDEPTPSFPIEGYPKFLQRFINECAETYRNPKDFWAGAATIATALAIGDKLELVTKYRNLPILWMMLVGQVSSGKSFPVDFCLKFFKKLDSQSFKKYEEAIEIYERVSKLSKKDCQEEGLDDKMKKPECFQYIIIDSTPEAMMAAHKTNNRGLLIERDELNAYIKDIGRYSKSGEIENMNSAWSGIGFTSNRKTSGILNIESPCISICGGIQPELLPSLAADSRADNGFLSRFCAIYPDGIETRTYNDSVLREEVAIQWEEYLSKLVNMTTHYKIRLSEEAEKKYADWYNKNAELIKSESEVFLKGAYAKLEIISLRLAIIVRGMNMVCEGVISEEISGEEMDQALAMTEYFKATARKVHHRIMEKTGTYTLDDKAVIRYLLKKGALNKTQIAEALKTNRQAVYRAIAE